MIYEKIKLNDEAYMTTYIAEDPLGADRKRPVVVICPGGGYECCSPREAEPIALAFNAAGIHAVVVNYRVFAVYPASLRDLSDAVCIVRDNAEKWRIDTERVVVCGFSAGGHLAASLGVFWNSEPAVKRDDEKNKPNGMILAYPVITAGPHAHEGSIRTVSGGDAELAEKMSLEKQVTEDCPRAFIWHTFEDPAVPVENSLLMAAALREKNIETELHIFPKGPHGLSTASEFVAESEQGVIPKVQEWIKMAVDWIFAL